MTRFPYPVWIQFPRKTVKLDGLFTILPKIQQIKDLNSSKLTKFLQNFNRHPIVRLNEK